VTPLAERIRDEIRASGPISFARFMERALYDPELGYYAAGGGKRLGPRGDYVTASDVGRGFGRAIARQLVEIDRILGASEPFDLVEFGAGRGVLARDVLDALADCAPDLAQRLRLVLADRSPAMREEASRLVPEARVVAPDEVEAGHRGVVLAIELFDALPVHRLRRRAGRLLEVFVAVDEQGLLIELERPCDGDVRLLAGRYGAAAGEGTEAEVAPAAPRLLELMAATLERGVLLVVDYGERAGRLYDPERPAGSLLAYSAHTTGSSYLERVGEQDLTAHVNFSALEECARELGLEVLGLTTQDRFLIASGILEVFEPAPRALLHDVGRAKERLQALHLIHPGTMGRRFKLLALGKRCRPRLSGLNDPFA